MTSEEIDKMSDEEYEAEYEDKYEYQDMPRDEMGEIIIDEDDSEHSKAIVLLNQNALILQKEEELFRKKIISEAGKLKTTNEMLSYARNRKKSMDDEFDIVRSENSKRKEEEVKETSKNLKASKEKEKFTQLEKNSKILIQQINQKGLCLWKSKSVYFYRKEINSPVDSGTKEEINTFISISIESPVKIVDMKSIVNKGNVTNDKIYKYILEYQIPIIKDTVFNPKENDFFEENGLMYQNSFIPTKYLKKRFVSQKGM
jgi:hypothetical protein